MSRSALPTHIGGVDGRRKQRGISCLADTVGDVNIDTASSIVLCAAEIQQLEALANQITVDPHTAPEEFCQQAWHAAMHLPGRIIEGLHSFSRWGSRPGIMIISGIPLSGVPATPLDNSKHVGELTGLARMQAVINEFLGRMVAYEAEGAGRLFQDMVPARAARHTQTSLSSEVELEVHTEQAFSDLRPDYLSLACLRGDPNAQTYVLRALDIVANVDSETVKLLRKPMWTTGVDESFRLGGREFVHGDVRGPMPIISGSEDDPLMILDQDLMTGITRQAQELLDNIRHLYLKHRRPYTLAPGQILILDNNRVAHGRSDFAARFDGTDRFIIRTFVVRDLMRSLHAREGDARVIAARFS